MLTYADFSEENTTLVSGLLSSIEPVRWDEFRVRKSTFEDQGYIPGLMLLAYRGNEFAGYFLGTTRGDTGYIKHMIVAPELRGTGVGAAMLLEGERRMQAAGMKKLVAGFSPRNYFRPGIEINDRSALCFFIKHGYTSDYVALVNMTVDLDDLDYDLRRDEERIHSRGFVLRRMEGKDRDRFIEQFDDGSWRESVLNSLVYPRAGTYYYEDSTGGIAGYACYGLRGANHFGPVWVREELRRTGLGMGRVLNTKAFEALHKNGHKWAEVICAGAIRFYVKCFDARIGRVFFVFEKALD